MKNKTITAFLAALMLAGSLSVTAEAATSGTSGNTVWKYDSGTKTVTFTGNGATGNYSGTDDVPWVSATKSGETTTLSAEKVIKTAENELHYVEKRSNSALYDKRANTGNNNYTKYAADLYPSLQANAWCDMFVGWCVWTASGKNKTVANKALCGGLGSAYTPTSASKYKSAGRWTTTDPKVGDQVFFRNSSRICHTGLVYKVTDTNIYTIEGNTLAQASSSSNGGEVLRKTYSRSFWKIAGYGHPIYNQSITQSTPLEIEKVVFKEGITKLGANLFTHRYDVKTLVIPKSVTEISAYAFSYGRGIDDVYYGGSAEDWRKVKIGIGNYHVEHADIHYGSVVSSSDSDSVDSLNKGTQTLEILSQPSSTTVEANKLHKFTIITNGVEADYSWQVSTDSGKTWRDFSEKWTAKTANLYFTVTPEMHGWKFRCVVSSGKKKVTSKAFMVSIKGVEEELKITKQPKKVTTKVGKKVTFTVKANTAAKYQWQYKTASGSKWLDVELWKSATSPKLEMTAKKKYNGWSFRCKVTAGTKSVNSKAVKLIYK